MSQKTSFSVIRPLLVERRMPLVAPLAASQQVVQHLSILDAGAEAAQVQRVVVNAQPLARIGSPPMPHVTTLHLQRREAAQTGKGRGMVVPHGQCSSSSSSWVATISRSRKGVAATVPKMRLLRSKVATIR